MERTMKQIEVIREGFKPVALRVSRLFFVLTDLINVDFGIVRVWLVFLTLGLLDADIGNRSWVVRL